MDNGLGKGFYASGCCWIEAKYIKKLPKSICVCFSLFLLVFWIELIMLLSILPQFGLAEWNDLHCTVLCFIAMSLFKGSFHSLCLPWVIKKWFLLSFCHKWKWFYCLLNIKILYNSLYSIALTLLKILADKPLIGWFLITDIFLPLGTKIILLHNEKYIPKFYLQWWEFWVFFCLWWDTTF